MQRQTKLTSSLLFAFALGLTLTLIVDYVPPSVYYYIGFPQRLFMKSGSYLVTFLMVFLLETLVIWFISYQTLAMIDRMIVGRREERMRQQNQSKQS